jgi:hypothetical protein
MDRQFYLRWRVNRQPQAQNGERNASRSNELSLPNDLSENARCVARSGQVR